MNRLKSTVRRQFAKRAGAYAASRSHAEGSDLDTLIELLDFRDSDVALDVATGPALVAARLAARAAAVVALDITGEMLARARRRLDEARVSNVRLVQADAEALPFADESFDVVTCRRSAHHFPEVRAAVEEAVRVLKSGGRLGIVDQVSPEDEPGYALQEALERLRDPGHARSLRATEWGTLIEEVGLRLRHLEVEEDPQTFEEWLERSGSDDDSRGAVSALLGQASRAALASIGFRDGDRSVFVKRRVVLLGEKT